MLKLQKFEKRKQDFCSVNLTPTFKVFKFKASNTTNTRHVCTYFNAFLMVIPNIVTKFPNFDFVLKNILWNFKKKSKPVIQTAKRIPGMFVLISMHFSWWFQIYSHQIPEFWWFKKPTILWNFGLYLSSAHALSGWYRVSPPKKTRKTLLNWL